MILQMSVNIQCRYFVQMILIYFKMEKNLEDIQMKINSELTEIAEYQKQNYWKSL